MYLGVDGGGTKTAYALIDARRRARASHVGAEHQSPGRRLRSGAGAAASKASARRSRSGRLRRPASAFAFFGLPAYGEDSATTAQLDAMPSALLDASQLPLRQRHGLQLGGLARLRRRHQRHRGHRLDGLRRVRGPTGALRRLGRADRRRRLRLLDRARGHEPVLAHERRARRARAAVSAGARAPWARRTTSISVRSIYGAGADRRDGFAQFARLVHDAAAGGRRRGRGHLHARREGTRGLRHRHAPRARSSGNGRHCPCRTAAACSTMSRRWWMPSGRGLRRRRSRSSTAGPSVPAGRRRRALCGAHRGQAVSIRQP